MSGLRSDHYNFCFDCSLIFQVETDSLWVSLQVLIYFYTLLLHINLSHRSAAEKKTIKASHKKITFTAKSPVAIFAFHVSMCCVCTCI